VGREVGNGVAQAAAEPRRQIGLEAHLGQIVLDGPLEVFRLPADSRVFGTGVVVGATVIDVFADAAPFELAPDAFARDRLAAVGLPVPKQNDPLYLHLRDKKRDVLKRRFELVRSRLIDRLRALMALKPHPNDSGTFDGSTNGVTFSTYGWVQ